MTENHVQAAVAKHPLSWIPEFFTLTDQRIRGQARLLGTSIMVGIGTGLAGVVFILACQIVMYFALWVGVGYKTTKPTNEHPPQWIEDPPSWMPQPRQGIEPWLLLLIPTIGGVLCGAIVFSFAPEAEGHGTDAVIAAYHDRKGFDPLPRPHCQNHCQRPHHRHGRIGRPRRTDHPDRRRSRRILRQPVPAQFASAPRPDGGRHGRRHRRHPSRSVGRRPVRLRGSLLVVGVRARSLDAGRPRQRRLLLHSRLLH